MSQEHKGVQGLGRPRHAQALTLPKSLTVSVLPVPAGPSGLPPRRVNMAAPSVM